MEQQQAETVQGRSIAYSRGITRRMMGTLDSNPYGNVHGGAIMRMVDEAAAIVAVRHARRPVVTVRIERFDFLKPAYLGNVVTVDCAMNYIEHTSMEVGVEVTAEDLLTGEVHRVASSQLIYVALDEHGRPTQVPPLIPADAQEEARIERVRLRRMRTRQLEEQLAKAVQEE
jgi:acyl-CoA hydrolase